MDERSSTTVVSTGDRPPRDSNWAPIVIVIALVLLVIVAVALLTGDDGDNDNDNGDLPGGDGNDPGDGDGGDLPGGDGGGGNETASPATFADPHWPA